MEEAGSTSEQRAITIKNSLGFPMVILIIAMVLFGLGWLSLSAYLVKGENEDLWISIGLLACGLPSVIYSVISILSPTIAIINDQGLYWARKKRNIAWEDIHGLTCEVEEKGNYPHRGIKARGLFPDSGSLFWCFLNDGEQLKADITRSNYSAETLYHEITSLYPDVRCDFVG